MIMRLLFTLLALLAVVAFACAQSKDDPLWQRALKLHREAIVVDTHADTTSLVLDEGFDIGQHSTRSHMDLPRMREGGLSAEFFAVYVSKSFVKDHMAAHRALEMIDAVRHEIVGRYPNDFTLA